MSGWGGSILESALAVAGLAALGWGAYLGALRLCGRASPSLRWAAAAILAYVHLSLVFWLLIGLQAFNRFAVLGLVVLPTLLLHRSDGTRGWERLRDDLRTLGQRLRPNARADRIALSLAGGATAVVLIARGLRGLATPPMATDALTYHLLRAGRWVRAGEWIPEAAPDAAGYYEHYPALGDALWAVAMLPFHGDTLVPLAGVLTLLTAVLGAYAAARSLGAEGLPALLGALALVSTPAVMVFVTTAYVDIPALALFLLALAWLAQAARVQQARELVVPALLCIGALSVGVGIKVPLLVPLGLAGLAFLVLLLRIRGSGKDKALVLAVLVAALLPALPGWLRETIQTGNPLYPFPVRIAGVELFAGNEENELNMSAAMAPAKARVFDAAAFVRALFWPKLSAGVQHLNFGPTGPLLLAGGLAGLGAAFRREQKIAATFLLLVIAAVVLSLFSTSMLAHRTFAAPAVGRLLSMVLGAAIVAMTLLRSRSVAWLLVVAAMLGAFLSWPRGWGPADTEAVTDLLLTAAPGLLLLAILGFSFRNRIASWPWAVAGLLVLLTAADRIRPNHRDAVWAAAVPAESFDPHPTDPVPSGAWTIWRELDEREGLRIAYTAGWDGRGHHWYRYPLLGSNLQHEVLYIPITKTGTIIDHRKDEELRANADVRAWLKRLQEQEVDVVVLGGPPSIEGLWVTRLPDVFELLATGERGRNAAFVVDADALERRLKW